MSGLGTDPDFRLNAFERLLLVALKVPEAPQPPEGSPDSLRVFRAGRNYYVWSIIMWALGTLVGGCRRRERQHSARHGRAACTSVG